MAEIPSLSTYRDWLFRQGKAEGLEATERINGEVVERVFQREKEKAYTLDVDATVIEAEKKSAQWTYKKVRDYQPILGFTAENGLCLTYEFRGGSVRAHAQVVEFLEKCEKACPEGKRIAYIRSDGAFYHARVIKWSEEKNKKYTITADKDEAVKAAIRAVVDWEKLRTPEGRETDREVGTAVHIMNGTKEAFLLVVQRWKNSQIDLFSPEEWCY